MVFGIECVLLFIGSSSVFLLCRFKYVGQKNILPSSQSNKIILFFALSPYTLFCYPHKKGNIPGNNQAITYCLLKYFYKKKPYISYF